MSAEVEQVRNYIVLIANNRLVFTRCLSKCWTSACLSPQDGCRSKGTQLLSSISFCLQRLNAVEQIVHGTGLNIIPHTGWCLAQHTHGQSSAARNSPTLRWKTRRGARQDWTPLYSPRWVIQSHVSESVRCHRKVAVHQNRSHFCKQEWPRIGFCTQNIYRLQTPVAKPQL